MTRSVVIMAIVIVAIGLVLWLKPHGSAVTRAPLDDLPAREPAHRVLLFADPREADSPCGCGEMIRMVRAAGERQGIVVEEFDPAREEEQVERHQVRVSPTVIISGPEGEEQARFEGESADAVARLKRALEALGSPGIDPSSSGDVS
ncbi:MAG: hypothetical protein JSV80_07120 [Acidobacteriota bacterium]|nr:MAG: hypothetical protein JSV80_07120 [Acidobacteriota bacterium]